MKFYEILFIIITILCLAIIAFVWFYGLWVTPIKDFTSVNQSTPTFGNLTMNLSNIYSYDLFVGLGSFDSWIAKFNDNYTFMEVNGKLCHQVTCPCIYDSNTTICQSICFKCEGELK